LVLLLVFALGPAQAHEPSGARMAVEPARELYVPFEDLHVVLEGGPKRVMLTREEYDALLAKARRATPEASAVQAVVRSAAYEAHVAEGRATITGAFTIETLAPGLHALPLDLGGVAMRSAKLGESDAALGMSADGQLMLFVE